MSEIKTILILGGAGFVGRAMTEKYLENNWRVIISTRVNSIDEVKDKLILHDFDIDLTDKKWSQLDNWLKLFNELNVTISSISRITNFVGETSKSASVISK